MEIDKELSLEESSISFDVKKVAKYYGVDEVYLVAKYYGVDEVYLMETVGCIDSVTGCCVIDVKRQHKWTCLECKKNVWLK